MVAALDEQRAGFLAGAAAATGDAVVRAAAERLTRDAARALTGVINGTGVLLHTNLGRAAGGRSA